MVVASTVFAGALPAGAAPRITCGGRSATIIGTGGNDVILGTRGRDVIFTGAGSDVIRARGGPDVVCAGPDADVVAAGGGTDRVFGGASTDLLSGGKGGDVLRGGGAADVVVGRGGADRLFGGIGSDAVTGGAADDLINGGRGTDVALFTAARGGVRVDLVSSFAVGHGRDELVAIESAVGGRGDDVLRGNHLANELVGRGGNDVLVGGGGDDVLQPLDGADRVLGGDGVDMLSYALARTAVTADPVVGDGTEELAGVEALRGSGGSDVLVGTDGADVLLGSLGDDRFVPGRGDDYIHGESWGEEQDTIDYRNSAQGVTVDLAAQIAVGEGTDTLLDIDRVEGSALDDRLTGTDQEESISGNGGNDRIDLLFRGSASGGEGDDVIAGGEYLSGGEGADELRAPPDHIPHELHGHAGNDTLIGSDGRDTFFPGPGDDVVDGGAPSSIGNEIFVAQDAVSYEDAAGAVDVDLIRGTATGEGTDMLVNIEDVRGTSFNDVIIGSDAQNLLTGGGGSDHLTAYGARDSLNGGSGDDVMYGGDDDDLLDGAEGIDHVDGGAGIDICFNGEPHVNCERL